MAKVSREILITILIKLALNDIFMFIDLSFASPVILCVKNNSKSAYDPESYRFAIDYGKLNTTMQH